MRKISVLILLASTALASSDFMGRFERFCQRSDQGRTVRGFLCGSAPLFQFLPTSGAGATAECACTNPTGAKGEILTLTRAGSAYCTIGNQATGLTDSSMVLCGNNLARITTAGTSYKKLQVETAATNLALQSQTLASATWLGGTTRTANAGVAPDGTMTATRVQISACAGTTSHLFQPVVSASAATGSVYAKGYAGASGSFSISFAGASPTATPVSFNGTTWTRLRATSSGSTTDLTIGCNDSVGYTGHSDTGAADVLLWGAQAELGATATSYIPTTTVAVARSQDVASIDMTSATPAWPTFTTASIAATVLAPTVTPGDTGWLGFSRPATTSRTTFYHAAASDDRLYVNGSYTGLTFALSVNTEYRLNGYWNSAGTSWCRNSSCVSTTSTAETQNLPVISLLDYAVSGTIGTRVQNGFIGDVCIDTDPTKCR